MNEMIVSNLGSSRDRAPAGASKEDGGFGDESPRRNINKIVQQDRQTSVNMPASCSLASTAVSSTGRSGDQAASSASGTNLAATRRSASEHNIGGPRLSWVEVYGS